MSPGRQAGWIQAAVFAWVGLQYAFVHDLPLLSDDHVHLAAAATWTSVHDLLAAEPRRPLQHLLFVFGQCFGDGAPAAMRAVGGVLYLAAIALVALVGRQLGMSPRRCALAAALFAAFPAGATVWWPAAVNAPGRLAATLLAWWAFGKGPSARFGALACAAAAAALAFHPSAVLLPALLLLQEWARRPPGARWLDGLAAALRAVARRPAFWGIVALVLAAAAWTRAAPHAHHGSRAGMAVIANLTWASAGLWPEALRVFAVNGVRGEYGLTPRIAGAICLLGFVAVALRLVRRDRGWLRCTLLFAALDLAFAAVVAGWTARYAFVAAAFAALGATWAAVTRAHVTVLAIVGALWLADSMRALVEFRDATLLSQELVAVAAAVRRTLPADAPLIVLDVPVATGLAGDTPLCNWGFVEAVRAAGATGEVRLVSTTRPRASSAATVVTAAAAQELRGTHTVLEFEPATRTFVHWHAGLRQERR